MSLYDVARALTLSIPCSARSWKKGDIVKHPDGYEVKITSGYYLDPTYGRLSNFWYWKRVLPDGKLGKEEHGYGW